MAGDAINVGILGYGIVGGGLYKVLTDNADSITQRVGRPVNVVKVADIDWDRPREFDVPAELRTTNAQEILEDESIQIVTDTVDLEVYFLDDGRIVVENWGSGEVVNRISNTPSS